MIQQTIFPRVNTHIAAINKSYRFNGGTATVQVDSLGNYEVIVNGSRFSSQENSAKRDANYKPAVSDISLKMVTSDLQEDIEARANALFQKEYDRQKYLHVRQQHGWPHLLNHVHLPS